MINLINKTNEQKTSNSNFIHFAINEGNTTILRNYLNNHTFNEAELTAALHLALKNKKIESALVLIEFGANPFKLGPDNKNAIYYASPSLEAIKSILCAYLEKHFPIQDILIKELISSTSIVALQFLSQVDSQELENIIPYSSTISNCILSICLIFNTSKLVKELIKNFDRKDLLSIIPHVFPLAVIFMAKNFPLATCFIHLLPVWQAIHSLVSNDIPLIIKELQNDSRAGILRGIASALKTASIVLPLLHSINALLQKERAIIPQEAASEEVNEATFFIHENHASVRIQDSLKTTHVGFAPAIQKGNSKFAIIDINVASHFFNKVKSGPISNIFAPLLPCPGKVSDESSYANEYFNSPHLQIRINSAQAKAGLDYIETLQRDCPIGPKCIYNVITRNCLDFAQEVYKTMGFAGHFTEHLNSNSKFNRAASSSEVAHVYIFLKETVKPSIPTLLKPIPNSENQAA